MVKVGSQDAGGKININVPTKITTIACDFSIGKVSKLLDSICGVQLGKNLLSNQLVNTSGVVAAHYQLRLELISICIGYKVCFLQPTAVPPSPLDKVRREADFFLG